MSTQRKKVLSRGSSPKWRSPNAFIPSLNDSSEPVESRITRVEAVGSASSAAGEREQQRRRAVPLSLAPGTTPREPISAIEAA